MRVGITELVFKVGDITLEDVDIIVNAANAGLMGGGGVDDAIHRAGGPSIMEELNQYRGCPTGQAVITDAGKLQADHIIHTVGPRWKGGDSGEDDLLHSAYVNSLLLAKEQGASTLAFPSISTGVYMFPIERAAFIALKAVKGFLERNAVFSEVRFVLFTQGDFDVYTRTAQKLDIKD